MNRNNIIFNDYLVCEFPGCGETDIVPCWDKDDIQMTHIFCEKHAIENGYCCSCGAHREHTTDDFFENTGMCNDCFEDALNEVQTDAGQWLCQCGTFIENGCHCPNCGVEPPWGCPCSDCQMPDEDNEFLEFDEMD